MFISASLSLQEIQVYEWKLFFGVCVKLEQGISLNY